ncbi:MAG: efflux RND transporter periplasmic adaptor subunit [Ramlibacter sp.]
MSHPFTRAHFLRLSSVLLATLLGVGCKPANITPAAAPPEDVKAVTVIAHDAPVIFEYMGQSESSHMVEIRARVDGYLQKKFYEEGSLVKEGAPLFQIDPKQLNATAQGARAALEQADSRLLNARQTVQRLKPLVAEEAVSLKDMDDAVAAEKSATAAVASAKADLSRVELELGYTKLVSPLAGLAGKANHSEGSYVSPGQNGLLTTVSALDPIFVNFNLSETEWLSYEEELKKGTLRFPSQGKVFDVQLILSNGTEFPTRGKLNFSSQTVDPQTGSYAVRAAFANHDLLLRPGQYVRVRLLGASRPGALLVPQRAVMQGQKGKFVYVVGAGEKAEMRPLELGQWVANQWLVTAGLKSGERVVTDGMLKVQPGEVLKVTADTSDGARASPATPSASAPSRPASR